MLQEQGSLFLFPLLPCFCREQAQLHMQNIDVVSRVSKQEVGGGEEEGFLSALPFPAM